MKKQNKTHTSMLSFLFTLTIVIVLGCKETGQIPDAKNASSDSPPADKKELTKSVQIQVDSLSKEEQDKKREQVFEEAISAIHETEAALKALDENKKYEALAALERATGKLELLLARNPSLALAPIDVNVTTYDMLTTLDDIKMARKNAEKFLKKGEVQKARSLLETMACEIVVSVTNIPLATYPKAIKAVSPLIDKNKMNEAKAALQGALNTLVLTRHIIPLPVVRAEQILQHAEALAENASRNQGGNDSLASMLENASYQLKMAEALGYGDKKDYQEFFKQIETIAQKTEKGKSGKGFFDRIKSSLSNFRTKLMS